MKTLLFFTIVLGSIGIRYLRWFALLQQKEYRFDRLKLFIFSSEGCREVCRLLPHRKDFTRLGLKRPKLTSRMLLTMVLTGLFLLLGAVMVVASCLFSPFILALGMTLYVVGSYLFAPVVVCLAALPTAFVARRVSMATAQKAATLIKAHKPDVIGITGSYGKSSTKLLLAHFLKHISVYATPKSYNTLLSIARSVVSGYKGEEIAIIEYAAYMPGEIASITKFIQPSMAVITGFAPQHLGLFGSEENIIHAKAELVAALPKNAPVYINAASEGAKRIAELGAKDNQAQIEAVSWKELFSKLDLTEEGYLTITYKGTKIKTQFVGKHYVELIALAWKVALQYLSEQQIAAALADFVPPTSFITSYTHSSGARVIDDGGTSNPQGFRALLSLVQEIAGTRDVTIITPGIVDLGDQSANIHAELTRQMKSVATTICYVGETEKEIVLAEGGTKVLSDQDLIIKHLSSLDKNDIVGIEGRMPAWVRAALENKHETSV